MAFSDETVLQAWRRAMGRCESCGKILNFNLRGVDAPQGWEAHHIHSVAANGHDGLSNCKILCQSCHKKTHSYGGGN